MKGGLGWMKNIGNDHRSLFNGNHFSSKNKICTYYILYIIGERSEPLSRVFNDQPRDIYIDGVCTYVQNASCYFSKLKLCSPIIVRTYVTLAL